MTFDPVQYKTTTRKQWEDAAEAWHRWGSTLETWLAESTDGMLDAAGVAAGGRVLDVAAGAGGQTVAAARRAGPDGHVVATDISPTILTYAAKQAAEAGLTNIETVEADGEQLGELADGRFEAAISRLGPIYLPDQVGALRGIREALRPDGRVSAVVYSTADRSGFFSVPVSIIRRRASLPAPGPGLPGPFSLGSPGALEQTLVSAGFRDVAVEAVDAPLRCRPPLRIDEKSGAQVIVAHITVQPGGHTPWHYHPGPHIVSVKTGTVAVYETDCSSTSYAAGKGFFDPGSTNQPHIHTLRNPSMREPAEVVITDIRDGDLRPTIAADPQPAACFS